MRSLSTIMAAVIGFTLICYPVPSQAQVVSYKVTRTLADGSKSVLKMRSNIGRDLLFWGTTAQLGWLAFWSAKPKSSHTPDNQPEPLPAPGAVP
jgi:hypothetical protein